MTALYHKRRTVHSIFQICISRNTKCAHKTCFPRLGHNWAIPSCWRGKFLQIITDCKEYLLKNKHLEGTNCFRFIKFAKFFPLENNSLYGIHTHRIKSIKNNFVTSSLMAKVWKPIIKKCVTYKLSCLFFNIKI